jgi:hypothetical protein
MKLKVLKDALVYYSRSADCTDSEHASVIEALEEVVRLEERYIDRAFWHDACDLITRDALLNLLNMATYDIYGRVRRVQGPKVTFDYYESACRSTAMLDGLTNKQLYDAYGYISDLWHDNEAAGANNTDGEFKRGSYERELLHEKLRQVKEATNTIQSESDDLDAVVEAQYKIQDIMTEIIDELLHIVK